MHYLCSSNDYRDKNQLFDHVVDAHNENVYINSPKHIFSILEFYFFPEIKCDVTLDRSFTSSADAAVTTDNFCNRNKALKVLAGSTLTKKPILLIGVALIMLLHCELLRLVTPHGEIFIVVKM